MAGILKVIFGIYIQRAEAHQVTKKTKIWKHFYSICSALPIYIFKHRVLQYFLERRFLIYLCKHLFLEIAYLVLRLYHLCFRFIRLFSSWALTLRIFASRLRGVIDF